MLLLSFDFRLGMLACHMRVSWAGPAGPVALERKSCLLGATPKHKVLSFAAAFFDVFFCLTLRWFLPNVRLDCVGVRLQASLLIFA